jgi:hypothetical protein
MPLQDDPSIPNEAVLLRALEKNWTIDSGEGRRPTSFAFKAANYETSFFVEEPGVIEEMRRHLSCPEGIAAVPARVVRECGLVIERRPDECPTTFQVNNRCHVVVGPPGTVRRTEYERMLK